MSYHVIARRRRWGMGQVIPLPPTTGCTSPKTNCDSSVPGCVNGCVTPTEAITAALDVYQNAGRPQGYTDNWQGGMLVGCPSPCAAPGSQPSPQQNAVLAAGIQVTNPSSGTACSCPSVEQLEAWGYPVPAGYPQSLFPSPASPSPSATGGASSGGASPVSLAPGSTPAVPGYVIAGDGTAAATGFSLSSIPWWAWAALAAVGLYMVVK